MNPILFLVFLLSPVACHISLRRYVADEARQAAQSIVQTLQKAASTRDVALFLSVFDKSFTLVLCGQTITYSLLEKIGIDSDPIQNGDKVQITSAVLAGDELTFVLVDKTPKGEEQLTVVAKKVGGAFKIFKINADKFSCSSWREQ